MSTYIEHYSISSHDVDINNNIKPSSFARLMQETGNHNMRGIEDLHMRSYLIMVKALLQREFSMRL